MNRDLATLRRMFKLAMEWKRVSVILPTVKLMPGEARRERVVSPGEEHAYLEKAGPLLKDFAILEFDCGLRPEEAHRLKWGQIRNGNVEIHTGKTKESRRSIPASPRVMAMLEERRGAASADDWIFPAPTKTGHISDDSLKKQHAAAIKASGVAPFVLYVLRHTCLTRWAESGMDTFTLKKLAGHSDIATTGRYVHMNDVGTRKAVEAAWKVQGGQIRAQCTALSLLPPLSLGRKIALSDSAPVCDPSKMSFAKREMERLDEQRQSAERIAVQAGVLRECEFHGTLLGTGSDSESAYRLGNAKFTKGELKDVFNDRKELTDAIKKAVEENCSDECNACEKWKED